MPLQRPDINCDLGEGIAQEDSIIPLIDVGSIACGGHTGDAVSIRKTLRSCLIHGKKVGAHPAYIDPKNFGRKSQKIPTDQLIQDIYGQIRLFQQIAFSENLPVDHIKFHGALYHDVAHNEALATRLVAFLQAEFPKIPLLLPPHSHLSRIAAAQSLPHRFEVFGDRVYTQGLQLLPRTENGAVLSIAEAVFDQVAEIINYSQISTREGQQILVPVDTICFHGDNPGILNFLPQIRQKWWD